MALRFIGTILFSYELSLRIQAREAENRMMS